MIRATGGQAIGNAKGTANSAIAKAYGTRNGENAVVAHVKELAGETAHVNDESADATRIEKVYWK